MDYVANKWSHSSILKQAMLAYVNHAQTVPGTDHYYQTNLQT